MRTKTRKRTNHRRKTYKGGIFEANKTNCNKKKPSEDFKRLYDVVDTKKYSRGFSTYNGFGCDLFLWVKKTKDPHIHVHGFTNNRFSYTISGLDIRNEEVELLSRMDEGYKYVLDKMCSNLTKGEHIPTSKLFTSPKKMISVVESPQVYKNKSFTNRSGIASDNFKDVSVKLGPIMGSVRDE